MDIMVYVCYLAIAAGVIVATYAIMRWIDYGFGKKESRNEAVYQAAVDARRYRMAKGLVNTYCSGQQRMAIDTVKKLNDGIFEMAKRMEEDL